MDDTIRIARPEPAPEASGGQTKRAIR